ncbi:MAG: hypothetical protein FVQ77_03655 [Cytophagales bacterium]|nr:hypothetical protein [Cytophagales bacterium]
MTTDINQYFKEIELHLLQSPKILDYSILRKNILLKEGKIRIKIYMRNGDIIELFEYAIEKSSKLIPQKYSVHWQDDNGNLKRRWDNAPHYKDLPNFPHHIHYINDRVESNTSVPNILEILLEIEDEID